MNKDSRPESGQIADAVHSAWPQADAATIAEVARIVKLANGWALTVHRCARGLTDEPAAYPDVAQLLAEPIEAENGDAAPAAS